MNNLTPLAATFNFWHPPTGYTVETGAESTDFLLPTIPLPLLNSKASEQTPSADMIGSGLYDYLRQFPDCPYNSEYAALLRDAWPHYLADLAAMIVMLDHKDVDAPYIRRKISGLQILLLLNSDNAGLKQQLGIAFYELALNYIELCHCRSHLTRAIRYFAEADKSLPHDPANLNYMAQIDYLLGDYPKAMERWQLLLTQVQDEPTQSTLLARIEKVKEQELPDHPLLVDLESIGEAMHFLASGEPEEAKAILEKLEQEQVVPTEFPNPEFYSLLAISRERSGDTCGAQAAFAKALELDPAHQESLDGLDRLI
jgi:tetratricopeptide (TPR) repeat protein